MGNSSAATENLVQAQARLLALQPVLRGIHDPLSKAVARFHDIDGRMQSLQNGLQTIIQFTKDLNATMSLAKNLSSLLPGVASVVGKVIDRLDAISRNSMTKLQQLAESMKTKIEDFKKKPWNGIKNTLNRVNNSYETVQSKMPNWIETTSVMVSRYKSIEQANVAGKPPVGKDQNASLPQPLINLSVSVSSVISTMDRAARSIKDSVDGISPIIMSDFLASSTFKTAMDKIQAAAEPFQKVAGACKRIEDAIRPFTKFLNRFTKIFNKLVDPVVKTVMNALGVNKLMDALVGKLESMIGMDEFSKMLNDGLKKFTNPPFITSLGNLEKVTSNDPNSQFVQNFDTLLRNFRQDPANNTAVLLKKSLSSNQSTAALTSSTKNALSSISAIAISPNTKVERIQDALDTFMQSSSLPAGSDSIGEAPKLGYAFYKENLPVSTILRTTQKPIVERQSQVAKITSLGDIPRTLASTPVASNDSEFPQFNKFVSRLQILSANMKTAKSSLTALESAAALVDKNYAVFDPEAGDFYLHFKSIVTGCDLLLANCSGALQSSINVMSGQAQTLKILSTQDEPSRKGTDEITSVSTTLNKLMVTINNFRGLVKMKFTETNGYDSIGDAYKSQGLQVEAIVNPFRYRETYSSSTAGLGSFIGALNSHFDSIGNWFDILNGLGNTISSNRSSLPNRKKTVQDTEELFAAVLPIVDEEIKDLISIPAEVQKLFDRMVTSLQDVQRYYSAGSQLFTLCRDYEGKLIAADIAFNQCTGIATNLKTLGQALSTGSNIDPLTLKSFRLVLSESIIPALSDVTALVSSFFNLVDTTTGMVALRKTLPFDIEKDQRGFDQELETFMKLMRLKEPLSQVLASGTDATVNPLLTPAIQLMVENVSQQIPETVTQ